MTFNDRIVVYSCISFIGVLFLLICTPLGFARLFTLVSNLIMKSTFRVDLKEELETASLDRSCILQRLDDLRRSEKANYEIEIFERRLDETESRMRKLGKSN